jgi:hypothetical protein
MTSALLRNGPDHLRSLEVGLRDWMDRHGFETLDQLRGRLSQRSVPDPAAFERANYIKTLASHPAARPAEGPASRVPLERRAISGHGRRQRPRGGRGDPARPADPHPARRPTRPSGPQEAHLPRHACAAASRSGGGCRSGPARCSTPTTGSRGPPGPPASSPLRPLLPGRRRRDGLEAGRPAQRRPRPKPRRGAKRRRAGRRRGHLAAHRPAPALWGALVGHCRRPSQRTHPGGDTPVELRLRLDAAGRIASLAFDRWGDPDNSGDLAGTGSVARSPATAASRGRPSPARAGWGGATARIGGRVCRRHRCPPGAPGSVGRALMDLR